jgi:hypothetical protein
MSSLVRLTKIFDTNILKDSGRNDIKYLWLDIKGELEKNPGMAVGLARVGIRHELFPLIQQTLADKDYYSSKWLGEGCAQFIAEIVKNSRERGVDLSSVLSVNLCDRAERKEITCSDDDAKWLYSLQRDIEEHKNLLVVLEKNLEIYRNAPVDPNLAIYYANLEGPPPPNAPMVVFESAAEKAQALRDIESGIQNARIKFQQLTEKRQRIIDRIKQQCPSLSTAGLDSSIRNYLDQTANLTSQRRKCRLECQKRGKECLDNANQKRISCYNPCPSLSGKERLDCINRCFGQYNEEVTKCNSNYLECIKCGSIPVLPSQSVAPQAVISTSTASAPAQASTSPGQTVIFSDWAVCVSRFPNDPEGQRQCMESMKKGPVEEASDVSTPAAVGAGSGLGTFLLLGAVALAAYWAYTNWFKKK